MQWKRYAGCAVLLWIVSCSDESDPNEADRARATDEAVSPYDASEVHDKAAFCQAAEDLVDFNQESTDLFEAGFERGSAAIPRLRHQLTMSTDAMHQATAGELKDGIDAYESAILATMDVISRAESADAATRAFQDQEEISTNTLSAAGEAVSRLGPLTNQLCGVSIDQPWQ